MANQIRGRILLVKPTETITILKTGKPFVKREVVIDATRFDPYTGQRNFENTPCVTFTGDKCQLLDNFVPGMFVAVDFDVFGHKSSAPNTPDKYFNDVRGYRIEEVKVYTAQDVPPQPSQTPQPVQQPQQVAQPQPVQTAQPAQQGYPQPQQGYAQPPQAYPYQGQPQSGYPQQPPTDDFPF